MSEKIVFKDYNPKQIMLLPPSLEELIEADHPVRVVNEVVDRIDIAPLLTGYKPGGTSVYHPRMLLKVLIYGYMSNIYSTRKLEAAIRQNVHFMWLAGMNKPDHNTIARFRCDRLKDSLKVIFAQIVMFLAEEGLLDLKTVYTDGTKIEAQANRYTFVWGRSIKTHTEKISQQLEELWDYTQRVAEEELYNEKPDFSKIDARKVSDTIDRIDQALKGKKIAKGKKQKLTYARKNWPGKLTEYEQKQAILGKRNSYSKTDHDATFMMMKEDHMRNGQLKPGYNLQISTSNQYLVNYTIHQNPTDTLTLKPHLNNYQQLYNTLPDTICADAGYGSEENYDYLKDKVEKAYVKYNYFHKEQTRKWKQDISRSQNLHYNEERDKVYCPAGQPMDHIGKRKTKTRSGYEQTYTQYQARNCLKCPLRSSCFKAKGNRIVEINHNLRTHKQKVRDMLMSDQGIAHRKQRPADVEVVFAAIKHNRGFRRFMMRGTEKVEIEAGLLAIAHNLLKKAS
ncbi:MAG: IS1182 family transposase [Cyclobacteriaceae bacterium]